ncbi:hypothetical protein CPT_Saba_003 [Proteus phage Saba]|uniref:Uncharacterized protein n=1 Tax=Proteus phage Saba TaxID=2596672 RepID=A0A5B9N9T7_9CAUD|nr:hypothetical protein JT320_gp03 [Proteus phage Saba]QEG09376.1 hypothetical protein CPT_Saba_003 [Proteus phage Saba]
MSTLDLFLSRVRASHRDAIISGESQPAMCVQAPSGRIVWVTATVPVTHRSFRIVTLVVVPNQEPQGSRVFMAGQWGDVVAHILKLYSGETC